MFPRVTCKVGISSRTTQLPDYNDCGGQLTFKKRWRKLSRSGFAKAWITIKMTRSFSDDVFHRTSASSYWSLVNVLTRSACASFERKGKGR